MSNSKQLIKADLIADLERVQQKSPSAPISRDFYRSHGKYSEGQWHKFFPTFKEFFLSIDKKLAPKSPQPPAAVPVEKLVDLDREKLRSKTEQHDKKYKHLLEENHRLERERDLAVSLREKTPQLYDIAPKVSSGTSESVAFMIASDWHSEERVLPGDVSGMNEFNLEIFEERSTRYFQGGQRLWDILRKDTHIKTIVLALLGDFISNTLHEDQQESNLLLPADAIHNAQAKIINGIRFLLEHTDSDLVVVCHSGNHGRMTKKQRHTTEAGNSLEQFMYYNIRDFFKEQPRVSFVIAEGYHTYLTLFDKYTIRFHHGHNIKYQGGVGGVYIPVNKSINQWNKAEMYRNVNLDVFGHFHSLHNAGNFVANGSLIGYNSYALAIKADYEKPQQAFFLVSKKYLSKTMFTPIFV
jgi:hypothetical protein